MDSKNSWCLGGCPVNKPRLKVDIIVVNLGTLRLISACMSTTLRQMEMNVEMVFEVGRQAQGAEFDERKSFSGWKDAVDLPCLTSIF